MLSDLHRVIGFLLQFNFYFVQNTIYRWFEEKFKTVSTPVALRDLRDLNCVWHVPPDHWTESLDWKEDNPVLCTCVEI